MHQVRQATTDPNNNKNVVSGIRRCQISIQVGFVGLSLLHSGMYWLLLKSETIRNVFGVLARRDYCVTATEDEVVAAAAGCQRPDLIAYKITSVISFTIIGFMGMYHWHFTSKMKNLAASSSPESRLFGPLRAADAQNVAILVYQVWDFFISLTIPEFIEPIFLIHHALAAATAWFSLDYQMVTYYSVYFGGCTEFSSIFLALADIDEMFEISSSFWLTLILMCKGLFTLTFTYYRVFGWWQHSWSLWSDSLQSLHSGTADTLRPGGKSFFLRIFLAMDVLLGLLQLYWFVCIAIKIAKML